MSIFSRCIAVAENAAKMKELGRSLAKILYSSECTVLLQGELGAGKTTFAQGFASGLGVEDKVTSPSFALEQRYAGFTHIDLYRLSRDQAHAFLMHSEEIGGIRLIEWAERVDRKEFGPHIHVHITDDGTKRGITCNFLDDPVPDDGQIDEWIRDVRLPEHIQSHVAAVTRVAEVLADALLASKKWLVRKEALHAAARTHDLLRFLDFPTWNGDPLYTPSDEDRRVWDGIKRKYKPPHEQAAATFLLDQHYRIVAEIVRAHGGMEKDGTVSAQSIEQKLLAYADKRVLFDRVVSLDERYDDFVRRHGKGAESEHAKAWRSAMKQMEKELFPDGAPKEM